MKNAHHLAQPVLLLVLVVALAAVLPVSGQSIGYVAFDGSDENPCSRVAPCATIGHTHTALPPGSVIDIIASGNYDTFTITKAVSVEADPGIVATILIPASGTGITVNAGASDTVTLKRLSLWGTGNGTGIQANTAATVVIEDCVSRAVSYATVLNSTAAAFKIVGGVFEGSDTSLFIRTSANNVSIDGVKIYGRSSNAAVDAVGNDIRITHSLLAGSGTSGFSPGVWVKGGNTVVLEDDVISGYGPGVQVSGGTGAGGAVFLSNNTITNNTTGVVVGTGTAHTRRNNTISSNTTNVSGTLTPFAAQ